MSIRLSLLLFQSHIKCLWLLSPLADLLFCPWPYELLPQSVFFLCSLESLNYGLDLLAPLDGFLLMTLLWPYLSLQQEVEQESFSEGLHPLQSFTLLMESCDFFFLLSGYWCANCLPETVYCLSYLINCFTFHQSLPIIWGVIQTLQTTTSTLWTNQLIFKH